jgi:hypothetical protein
MTAIAIPIVNASRGVIAELIERHATLARYGLALMLLAAIAVLLQALDPRTLEGGVNVWVKPAKFLSSVGIFALTAAWFSGYVRPERRRSVPVRAVAALILIAGTFELVWITWQGASGLESHFNFDTPFYRLMFNLMGVFAVLLLGATLPLAWEIARRPAPGLAADFVTAVAAGLVLSFLLGSWFGYAIAANNSHAVGPEAGHFPLFGWNRAGGDLRVAHFLGIHAMQTIPILTALTGGLGTRMRWGILGAGSAIYVGLTVALYAQAAAGRALLPF